ncbi:predicted protein [Naegleria gruberi]|uniref:Predicted protein n=1 Tax=Naegleria gruberi TaxID=5762 RepID=D2VNN2_NAEGR|nr:uncharacterized protein NAEGRDRAFT_70558 [Naegleria gruberi]EFC41437.1 predicted protein [Naegleria gruberi]|eukprot:XP_002674181.1 predicted protein [Naegleria gruberi strain NEG-M]
MSKRDLKPLSKSLFSFLKNQDSDEEETDTFSRIQPYVNNHQYETVDFTDRRNEFYRLMRKGIIARMEENYVEACKYLDLALELEPDNYEVYLEKSICLSLFHRTLSSIRVLVHGLNHSKRSYWFNDNERELEREYFGCLFRGLIEEVNDQQEASLKLYDQACKLYPTGFYALFSYAYALGSISLNPSTTLAPNVRENYMNQACEYFKKALTSIRNSPLHSKFHTYYICILYTNIAWVIRENNQIDDEALDYYSEAIKLNGKHLRSYLSRASLYSKKRENGKSISDFTACIEIKEKQTPRWIGIVDKMKVFFKDMEQDSHIIFTTIYLFMSRHLVEIFTMKYIDNFQVDTPETTITTSGTLLNKQQTKDYEKRLSDLYEERGIQFLDDNKIEEALLDFTAAKIICPFRAHPYIFTYFIGINVIDRSKCFSILENYLEFMECESNIRGVISEESLSQFDMSTLYKHISQLYEEQNQSKQAKSSRLKEKQLLNYSRIC